jgi:hypothetical protein
MTGLVPDNVAKDAGEVDLRGRIGGTNHPILPSTVRFTNQDQQDLGLDVGDSATAHRSFR